ncbi:rRNA maturation RNase YbeY [Dokdonia sp. Hel_I_53]|uniref:rRNA maturation RNase YbeY n=1 Tax=Dokdonia sp. Hel_I_53 TaxID=1566287 RepID=UPI001198FEF8|nr:rRNA maturation RNase YbeY [Dokdonia sp. Hel_I_53]TVZ52648.1 rRNA maturation RNase YbeY [Dokdonia sp. Hel_I_53]
MIEFNSTNEFQIVNPERIILWLSNVIISEKKDIGEINFIFCDDAYLHKLNVDFLNHDTLTDIISFDYSQGNVLNGDIYISTQRVEENASDFNVSFSDELCRVMVHGILHYCGYKDKLEEEKKLMRSKENLYLALMG